MVAVCLYNPDVRHQVNHVDEQKICFGKIFN